MVTHILAFLQTPTIGSWFGGGFVVLAGGIWVIFKFAWSEKPRLSQFLRLQQELMTVT